VERADFPADALRGIHVLVVEDDDDSRELLETILVYCGALVTAAASALEAMNILRRVTADVLLSDISMPEQDGYWLIREVRALPPERGGTIPAVAITAHGYPHGADRTLTAGFQAHLCKPVDPWELARTIATLVGRSA
jgi:CheY-like chemotaxis protein